MPVNKVFVREIV